MTQISRRQFLSTAATGTAAGLVGVPELFAGEKSPFEGVFRNPEYVKTLDQIQEGNSTNQQGILNQTVVNMPVVSEPMDRGPAAYADTARREQIEAWDRQQGRQITRVPEPVRQDGPPPFPEPMDKGPAAYADPARREQIEAWERYKSSLQRRATEPVRHEGRPSFPEPMDKGPAAYADPARREQIEAWERYRQTLKPQIPETQWETRPKVVPKAEIKMEGGAWRLDSQVIAGEKTVAFNLEVDSKQSVVTGRDKHGRTITMMPTEKSLCKVGETGYCLVIKTPRIGLNPASEMIGYVEDKPGTDGRKLIGLVQSDGKSVEISMKKQQ